MNSTYRPQRKRPFSLTSAQRNGLRTIRFAIPALRLSIVGSRSSRFNRLSCSLGFANWRLVLSFSQEKSPIPQSWTVRFGASKTTPTTPMFASLGTSLRRPRFVIVWRSMVFHANLSQAIRLMLKGGTAYALSKQGKVVRLSGPSRLLVRALTSIGRIVDSSSTVHSIQRRTTRPRTGTSASVNIGP